MQLPGIRHSLQRSSGCRKEGCQSVEAPTLSFRNRGSPRRAQNSRKTFGTWFSREKYIVEIHTLQPLLDASKYSGGPAGQKRGCD